MYDVLRTMCYVLRTMHLVLCVMCSVPCTMYYILHSICDIQYTIDNILYTMYYKLLRYTISYIHDKLYILCILYRTYCVLYII